MNQFVQIGFLFIGAILTALGSIAVFAVLMDTEKTWRRHASPLVLATILFAMAAGTLLSGRNVSLAGEDFSGVVANASAVSSWLLRLCTLVAVGIAAARMTVIVVRKERIDAPGLGLLLGFLGFFVTNSITNAVLGTYPSFVHGMYYASLVFVVAYLGRSFPATTALVVARNGVLVFMILSLLVAVVKPELAVQNNYAGLIPGLHIRFWGLGSNPNSIGPLAFVLILTVLLVPFNSRMMNALSYGVAALILLLAQSKTAWGAVVLSLLAMYTYRYFSRATTPARKFNQSLVLWAAACFLSAAVVVLFFAFDLRERVEGVLTSKEGMQYVTLTGRAAIWEVALSAFSGNPLFGYGVTMWSPMHRFSIGMPFAMSAHNQWLQSLGGAGLFGFAGLLVYMAFIVRYAWRSRSQTGGVSIALVAFLFIRCVSETPLETDTLFNADVFTHLLTFIILVSFANSQGSLKAEGVR